MTAPDDPLFWESGSGTPQQLDAHQSAARTFGPLPNDLGLPGSAAHAFSVVGLNINRDGALIVPSVKVPM